MAETTQSGEDTPNDIDDESIEDEAYDIMSDERDAAQQDNSND